MQKKTSHAKSVTSVFLILTLLLQPLLYQYSYAQEVVPSPSKPQNGSESTLWKSTSNTSNPMLLGAEKALVIAQAIAKNGLLQGGAQISNSGGQGSNANNLKLPIAVSVDERTGGLNMQLPIAAVSSLGVLPLDLNLQYDAHEYSNAVLGLPAGWTYAWFSWFDTNKKILHLKGGQTYSIDPGDSLRYYKLKDLVFSSQGGTYHSQSDGDIAYSYTFKSGINALGVARTTEYFDNYGVLRVIEDSNKNNIIFNYDGKTDISQKHLLNIRDSENRVYTFDYNGTDSNGVYAWKMTLPDQKRSYALYTNSGLVSKFVNPINAQNSQAGITSFDYSHANQTIITTPLGAKIEITFDQFSKNGKPAACAADAPSSGTDCPSVSEPLTRVASVVTKSASTGNVLKKLTYTYTKGDNQDDHNYTGFPLYSAVSADDLTQKSDNNYTYQTAVDDGVSFTQKTFNKYHLEIIADVFSSKNHNLKIAHTLNVYTGRSKSTPYNFPQYDQLPANYQAPSDVYTTRYGEDGSSPSGQHHTHTELDNYGNPTDVLETEFVRNGSTGAFSTQETPVKETKTSYDPTSLTVTTDVFDRKNTDPNTNTQETKTTYDSALNPLTLKKGFVVGGALQANSKQTTIVYSDVSLNGKTFHLPQNKSVGFVGVQATQTTAYSYSYDGSTYLNLTTTVSGSGTTPVSTQQQIEFATGFLKASSAGTTKPTTYEYDSVSGRKTRETSPMGQITNFSYSDYTESTPESSVTTSYQDGYSTRENYDGLGRVVQTSNSLYSSDLSKAVTQTVYMQSFPFGKVDHEVDVFGRTTQYSYDERARVQSVVQQLTTDGKSSNTTSYGYDTLNRVRATCLNGYLLKTEYLDDSGQVTNAVEYPSGVPASGSCPTSSGLQATYQNSAVIYNGLDQAVDIQTQTSIVGSSSRLAADLHLNHIDGIVFDSDEKKTAEHLLGWDSIDIKTNYTRDFFGNITYKDLQITDPSNKNIGKSTADTSTFDALNRIQKRCSNTKAICHSYTYDGSGRMQTRADNAGGTFTYTYNDNGQVTGETYTTTSFSQSSKSSTSFFGFINPLLGKMGVKTAAPSATVYTYNSDGELQSIAKDGQTLSYDYYPNRKGLKSITYPDGKQVLFDYDNYGRMISETDMIGNVTSYSYDSSFLKTVKRGNDSVVYDYYLDNNSLNSGKIHTITIGNIQTTLTYFGSSSSGSEAQNNLHGFDNIQNITTTQNGDEIQNITYTHDSAGNISSVTYASKKNPTDPNANYTETYTYNSVNQLLTASRTGQNPSQTTYTYDGNGNITSRTVVSSSGTVTKTFGYLTDPTDLGSYDDNKLLSVTEGGVKSTLKYDAKGNLTDDGKGNTFAYDEKNRLIHFENGLTKTLANYTYYPNGLRASKEVSVNGVSQGKISFYYDHSRNPNIINEVQTTAQGTTTSSYLMSGSNRYARYLSSSPTTPRFYISNHKDTSVIIDSAGKASYYSYTPYGVQKGTIPNPLPLGSIAENPFLYSSAYTDQETGFQYLIARYYDPENMRFITRDGAENSRNKYIYANDNPINNTDPSGMFPEFLKKFFSTGNILGMVVDVAAGALIGFAAGLVTGGAGGALGVIFTEALAGAGGAAAGGGAQALIDRQKFSWTNVGLGAGLGGLGGLAGGLGGRALRQSRGGSVEEVSVGSEGSVSRHLDEEVARHYASEQQKKEIMNRYKQAATEVYRKYGFQAAPEDAGGSATSGLRYVTGLAPTKGVEEQMGLAGYLPEEGGRFSFDTGKTLNNPFIVHLYAQQIARSEKLSYGWATHMLLGIRDLENAQIKELLELQQGLLQQ